MREKPSDALLDAAPLQFECKLRSEIARARLNGAGESAWCAGIKRDRLKPCLLARNARSGVVPSG